MNRLEAALTDNAIGTCRHSPPLNVQRWLAGQLEYNDGECLCKVRCCQRRNLTTRRLNLPLCRHPFFDISLMQQTFFWSCEALSACFRFADALMVTGARRRCLSADLKVQRVRQCTVCGCTRVCPRRRHRATIAYKFINRHWCESAAEEFDIAPQLFVLCNWRACATLRLCQGLGINDR